MMGHVILFFGAILLALGIGLCAKINLGIVGIALSFLLCEFCLGLSTSDVIAQFPTQLFFALFITTLFYGFANENGALEGISQRIIRRFSHLEWSVPFLLLLSSGVVSALGAGAMATPVILSPIAFTMAQRFRFHPLLASLSVWCGTMLGDSMPWGVTYQSNLARYAVFFDPAVAARALLARTGWSLVLYPALFSAFYLLLRRRGTGESGALREKPEPFTHQQRFTMWVVAGVITLVLLPGIAVTIVQNPMLIWMKNKLSVQLLAAVGAVLLGAFHAADLSAVLRQRVPWSMILTITGLTMLMSFSTQMGVLESMSQWLGQWLPQWSILPALILLIGTLTYFLDGRAIASLMIPLLPALAQAAGCAPEEMILVYMFAGSIPSISPFFTGGAMALSGCTEESQRARCIRSQSWLPWPLLGILILLGGLGLFRIGF